MELFTIEENQVIIRPELRMIPQFKKIITRDKDRYKRQALLELAYIYYMYDYKSPYMNISDIDRHSQIIKHLKLGENWDLDSDLKEAVNQYLEFQETPSIKALKSTRNALLNASKVIDVMNHTTEQALEDEDMVTAIETTEKLLTLADKLPKTINTIVTLEEKVQKEQHENSKVRGGGKAGIYE